MEYDFTCAPSPPSNGYTAAALTVTLATPERPGVNAAPSPVWFDVDSVTGCDTEGPGVGEARDPRMHDLTYVWDFGDVANATPSTAASLMMFSEWKNINKAYGKRVCHVFNDPGTYTVKCTVYEKSTMRKGVSYLQVTVADPKAVFTGNRTIIFDPNSVVADPATYGYPGATMCTTWPLGAGSVTSARNALGATTAQILFAPGAELVGTQMASSPSWGNIRIGALDPEEAKPIIRDYIGESGNLITDNSPSLNIERVVFGLDFRGPWDSTTELGYIVDPFRTFAPTTASYLCLHHRCDFSGWGGITTFAGNTGTVDTYACHSELLVTDWQNYGLTTAGDNAAVIGCRVMQHVDALSGGAKDSGFYNNHGCLRDFNSASIHVSVCDMFSRNGWSAGGTGADGLSITSDQACIRLNTNGATGCGGYLDRLAMEGMIWIEEQDSNNTDVPVNYIFDKILQVMGPRTLQEGIELRYGGCTFRNMLGVILNAPSAQTNRPGRWFYLSNENGAADNDAGIDIYNCTLLDLRDNTNANNNTMVFKLDDDGPGDTFLVQTVENNVFAQPNRSPAIVPDTVDLATMISGYTPRHRGTRINFLREAGTLAGNVAPGGSILIPYSEIKTTRYNQSLDDTGAATDEAYWTANAGTKHKLTVFDPVSNPPTGILYTYHHQAITPDPLVVFEATGARFYNRTGSLTWLTGWQWELMLDRATVIPAFTSTHDVRSLTVPLPRPTGDVSSTPGTKLAIDDLLGDFRDDERGALLPA